MQLLLDEQHRFHPRPRDVRDVKPGAIYREHTIGRQSGWRLAARTIRTHQLPGSLRQLQSRGGKVVETIYPGRTDRLLCTFTRYTIIDASGDALEGSPVLFVTGRMQNAQH